MATFDLQAHNKENTHLLSFCTSSRHQNPFKTKPKAFVPKTIPKIHNNLTDTYDMEMKLYWLTNMTKRNIHL